jgi:hypothetical protein
MAITIQGVKRKDRNTVESGWPDATNTGWQAAMGSLTAMGSTTISTASTTVDLRSITGPLGVNAANVTIKRSTITGGFFAVDASANADNLLIEDCTISNITATGILFDGLTGITIRRCNIYDSEDAIKGSGTNVLVEDCYLHDPKVAGADPHNDGFQIQGANGVIVRRNRIQWVDTSCISMFDGQGIVDDCLIENNYLGSKGSAAPNLVGWLLYLAGSGGTNIRVLNNHFGNWLYGPGTDFNSGATGNLWSGNVRASDATAPASPAPGAAVNP